MTVRVQFALAPFVHEVMNIYNVIDSFVSQRGEKELTYCARTSTRVKSSGHALETAELLFVYSQTIAEHNAVEFIEMQF